MSETGTGALDPEWADRIEQLREQSDMRECSCGRFFDPHSQTGKRTYGRCRDCRKAGFD